MGRVFWRHVRAPTSVRKTPFGVLVTIEAKTGGIMLWYCRFRWHEHTRAEDVRRRVLEQHEAGTNRAEKIRGWYNLAGGGSGFLIVDTDDPRELTEVLQPYMDLVSWDVHAIYELTYNRMIEQFRQQLHALA